MDKVQAGLTSIQLDFWLLVLALGSLFRCGRRHVYHVLICFSMGLRFGIAGQEPTVSFWSFGTAKSIQKYSRVTSFMELCQIVSGTTVPICWIMAHWFQERAQEAAKEQLERSNATSLTKQAAKLVDEVEAHPAPALLVLCLRCLYVSQTQRGSQRSIPVGNFISAFFFPLAYSTQQLLP